MESNNTEDVPGSTDWVINQIFGHLADFASNPITDNPVAQKPANGGSEEIKSDSLVELDPIQNYENESSHLSSTELPEYLHIPNVPASVEEPLGKEVELQLLEMLESKTITDTANISSKNDFTNFTMVTHNGAETIAELPCPIGSSPLPNAEAVNTPNSSMIPATIEQDVKRSTKTVIKCFNCYCIFDRVSFKKHVCDYDEKHNLIVPLPPQYHKNIILPTSDSIEIRLKRENQIRIKRFFKEELRYDLNTITLTSLSSLAAINHSNTAMLNTIQCENSRIVANMNKKQDGPHECSLCERRFVHPSGLLRHMEKHVLDLVPTSMSNQQTTNSKSLDIINQPANGLRVVVKCLICGRIFFDDKCFIDHMNIHFSIEGSDEEEADIDEENNSIFELNLNEVLKFLSELVIKEESTVGADPFSELVNPMTSVYKIVLLANVLQCEYCDYIFSEPFFLFHHTTTTHVADYTYECFDCEIKMQTVKEAMTHWQAECVFTRETLKVNNCLGTRYFVCNVCEDKYQTHDLLLDHRYIAYHFLPRPCIRSGNLMVPCEYCEEIFDRSYDLFTHYTEKHSKKIKRDKECEKGKSEKTRMYLCDVCGKSYTQSSHLWQHLRFHQGVKPFACKIPGCNRKFTIRPDLNDHIRKCHTGERPYHCIICGKRFLTGSVYYQHRLIHRGERRYECDECGKRFYRADALKNHLRIHTGEKPFDCDFCTKRFRQRGDRDKHMRARHARLDPKSRTMMQMNKKQLEQAAAANTSAYNFSDDEDFSVASDSLSGSTPKNYNWFLFEDLPTPKENKGKSTNRKPHGTSKGQGGKRGKKLKYV